MAYLNTEDREKLLNELLNMNFMRAKRKLRRMDPKANIRVFRGVMTVDRWLTLYELPSLGINVRLIETYSYEGEGTRRDTDFELIEVIVEATPDNRT